MMESADLRDGDDFALLRPLDGAAGRRVPGEGEVAPGVMVIPQVRPKDPAQVLLRAGCERCRACRSLSTRECVMFNGYAADEFLVATPALHTSNTCPARRRSKASAI
jgi:hypothetical protein